MYIIQISFPLSRMRLLLKWLTGVQRMFLFEPTWHQSCSSIVFARLMYFILVIRYPYVIFLMKWNILIWKNEGCLRFIVIDILQPTHFEIGTLILTHEGAAWRNW